MYRFTAHRNANFLYSRIYGRLHFSTSISFGRMGPLHLNRTRIHPRDESQTEPGLWLETIPPQGPSIFNGVRLAKTRVPLWARWKSIDLVGLFLGSSAALLATTFVIKIFFEEYSLIVECISLLKKDFVFIKNLN